jgi:outer membrane lipoprotein-sorting protein
MWRFAPDFRAMVQDRLRDLQMDVKAEGVRLGELRKINKDFANAYRFKWMKVYYKEPLKLRLESEVLSRRITYILNGGIKLVIAPGQRVRDDVSNSPGKRQTPLDFGFITPAVARQLDATFQREEKEGNTTLYVFKLEWNYGDDDATHIVWFDPEKRYTARRVWYSRTGKYRARFEYKEPVEAAPGIWIPTRVEVYNADQRFGGRTVNSNIKVNQGLDDSLFSV